MSIKRKIYSSWAYTDNEIEKSKINKEIYKELKDKYRVSFSDTVYNPELHCAEKVNFDDYDLVFVGSIGYAKKTYRIVKNSTNLSYEEIALICDKGNLCFGYSASNNTVVVYTD